MDKTIAEFLHEQREYLEEYGRKQGLRKGEVHARRQWLVRLLRNKFGKVPVAAIKRIEATKRLDLLDVWFDCALLAKKIEDLSFATG